MQHTGGPLADTVRPCHQPTIDALDARTKAGLVLENVNLCTGRNGDGGPRPPVELSVILAGATDVQDHRLLSAVAQGAIEFG